jgi:plastocyanin
MRARKSAGVAERLSTLALIFAMALIVLTGAFAADVFAPSASDTTTASSTQSYPSTQLGASTSFADGASASTSSSSLTSTSTRTLSSTATGSSTSANVSSTTSSATNSSSSASTTTATSSTSTRPGTVVITLPEDVGDNESLNFTPSKVKVVIGVNNTIVWNDTDYVQHTVESVSVPSGAETWNSGILNEGQTFTVVLTVPGNYKYDCSIHPGWMVGTIQVLP